MVQNTFCEDKQCFMHSLYLRFVSLARQLTLNFLTNRLYYVYFLLDVYLRDLSVQLIELLSHQVFLFFTLDHLHPFVHLAVLCFRICNSFLSWRSSVEPWLFCFCSLIFLLVFLIIERSRYRLPYKIVFY